MTANRRYLLIGVILPASLLLVVAMVSLRARLARAALEERIAAINARHALPAEENAATIYDQLLTGTVIVGGRDDGTLTPEALAALLRAAQMESCWFPLSPGSSCYRDHARRISAMREWVRALANAAEKDVTDGRVEAAAAKLRGMMQMGRHVRRQPLVIDFMAGTGMEAFAGRALCNIIMQTEATEEHLRMAEALAGPLANDWPQVSQTMLVVQPLLTASAAAELSLRQRLQYWWSEFGAKSTEEITREMYLRLVSQRRAVRLLVALRRYHDAHNRWPAGLEELAALVPAAALLDPYTGQPFVYETVGDSFRLYACGPNRLDEGGSHADEADDYSLWPP
jgi:hypothetical protein